MLLLTNSFTVPNCINQKWSASKFCGNTRILWILGKLKWCLICQSWLVNLLSMNCAFQNFTSHWFLKQWESFLKSLISQALSPEAERYFHQCLLFQMTKNSKVWCRSDLPLFIVSLDFWKARIFLLWLCKAGREQEKKKNNTCLSLL